MEPIAFLYIVIGIFVVIIIARTIKIVNQSTALVVERLGKYYKTMTPGINFLMPFVDKVRMTQSLKEQVASFPPQSVITADNLVVSIDTVIYFQVTNPKDATYEISNYLYGIEQLVATTIRNVIGNMDLEQTLTSRDQINGQLRGVLDSATGKWGIRVNRVELKSIDPPASIQDSMEKQMRAERDRRATILHAEGTKQSQILTAEGMKQAAILTAEGEAQSKILRAEGEARAIIEVFDAIHEGDADPKLLAYQYLQMLPEIAKSESSKVWFVPTEFTSALGAISAGFGGDGAPSFDGEAFKKTPAKKRESVRERKSALVDPAIALAEAKRSAAEASGDAHSSGTASGAAFDDEVTKGQ